MADIDRIEDYLSRVPENVQPACRALHALVVSQLPGAHAMLAHGALGYGPSPSSFDRVIYIAPQSSWVNLGFFFGADIPDPQHLLEGTGKRMRHIKIRDEREAKNPAIKRILKAAWKKAPGDIASIRGKRAKG